MAPCGHSFCCRECSDRVKKCLVCKEMVKDQLVIPDQCYVCDDNPPSVQFQPCLHLIACEGCSKLAKRCLQCREPIRNKISYSKGTLTNRTSPVEKNAFGNEKGYGKREPRMRPRVKYNFFYV